MFDLDGTLIDSRHDLTTAVNLLRRDYDLPPLPVETVTGYVGDGIRVLVERSLRGYPVNIEKATRECAEYYRRHLHDQTTLYPGVDDGLRRLHAAGHALALISNKPIAACREILSHFGLLPLFAVVLGGGDTQHMKPHPEPLLTAMSRLHAPAANTWMIGDNRTDLEAGRRAGVRTAFLSCGMGEAGDEKPTQAFESFTALADHILA
jgi:phosphoglycolate phosphatase